MDDISQITNLINLYAVAVDSRRYGLFEQIFTQDIQCDFGGGAGFSERDTFISAFEQIHAPFSATQHMTSGHTIMVEGEDAWCFSYVHGRFRRELDNAQALFESTGWYDDVLIKGDEGWRIQRRISRMVSYAGDARVMQAMPGVDTNFVLAALHEDGDAGAVAVLHQVGRTKELGS